MIQLNNEKSWLYAVVKPDANRLLHIHLFPTRPRFWPRDFYLNSTGNISSSTRSYSSMVHRGCRLSTTGWDFESNTSQWESKHYQNTWNNIIRRIYYCSNTFCHVEPSNDDERHIKSFLDSLDGEQRVEEDAYLPLTIGGGQVTIPRIVDLVHIRLDTFIIEFKTDLGRYGEDEYRKQLSVYYHVLAEWFPDRDITAGRLCARKVSKMGNDPVQVE